MSICLQGNSGAEPPAVQTLTHLITSEAKRCRVLSISCLTSFRSLLPLSGSWPILSDLTVEFPEDKTDVFPLFPEEARFPSLRQLALSPETGGLSVDHIDGYFANSSANARFTNLRVEEMEVTPEELVHLLSKFPNLITRIALLDISLRVVPPPTLQITSLLGLCTLRLEQCDDPTKFLTRIHAPRLQILQIIHTNTEVFRHFPDLLTLELKGGAGFNVGLVDIITSRGTTPSSVYYGLPIKKLSARLCDLVASLRSRSLIAGSVERFASHGDPFWADRPITLSIAALRQWLKPDEMPEGSSDEVAGFLLELESLAILLEARKQIHPVRFRLHLTQRMIEWWPVIAETVSRFPDFLEVRRLETIALDEEEDGRWGSWR